MYADMPNGYTRDYVYVEDVVETNRLVSEKAVNTVIRISSEEEIAILEMLKKMLR
ncbi:hypothetical protein [Listeria grandensis]|uniref:hypothetical protein n=1 Tax=Listeria grandensis TaxID=1494963 RepID=UPI00164ED0D9|nr:hypothetical protein [Listeria grandensis]